uniref:Sugar phosphate transporter domain-containing protein n=1 Tax=Zooxanthella nutricula TaxID=1333877 RepID=A0A7S2QD73_9DINO
MVAGAPARPPLGVALPAAQALFADERKDCESLGCQDQSDCLVLAHRWASRSRRRPRVFQIAAGGAAAEVAAAEDNAATSPFAEPLVGGRADRAALAVIRMPPQLTAAHAPPEGPAGFSTPEAVASWTVGAAGERFPRRGPSLQAENLQSIVVIGAIVIGFALWMMDKRISALILLYFGVNTGFSLYMKFLLSDTEICRELGLQGVPAGFLITAVQQVESFVAFGIAMLALWPTRWRWSPGKLRTWHNGVLMLFFAMSFSANIGLNNLSVALLPVSLNMTMRSCLPLVTLAVQVLFRRTNITGIGLGPLAQIVHPSVAEASPSEIVLMFIGVLFAALATVANPGDPYAQSEAEGHRAFKLGVLACCLSIVAAAINLALAGVLCTRAKLSALDLTWYMALPSALFLVPSIFCLYHPAQWPGFGSLTDWQVWRKVASCSPTTSVAIIVSGGLAICNNMIQYWLVQRLNATHTAFAGNVNKAVTISLSMALGVETLPGGVWSGVMLFAVLGNLASFAGYTVIKATRGFKSLEDATPAATPGTYRRGWRSTSQLPLSPSPSPASTCTGGSSTARASAWAARIWSPEPDKPDKQYA